MTLDEFMKRGLYLPPVLRDFHDQKDVFKAIDIVVHRVMDNPNQDTHTKMILKELPGWVLLHIYVVDYFLWYMARRGYTLQRSRARVDFIEYNPYKEWFDEYIKYDPFVKNEDGKS